MVVWDFDDVAVPELFSDLPLTPHPYFCKSHK